MCSSETVSYVTSKGASKTESNGEIRAGGSILEASRESVGRTHTVIEVYIE